MINSSARLGAWAAWVYGMTVGENGFAQWCPQAANFGNHLWPVIDHDNTKIGTWRSQTHRVIRWSFLSALVSQLELSKSPWFAWVGVGYLVPLPRALIPSCWATRERETDLCTTGYRASSWSCALSWTLCRAPHAQPHRVTKFSVSLLPVFFFKWPDASCFADLPAIPPVFSFLLWALPWW